MVAAMEAEGWDLDEAAHQFDLDALAVAEAVDYVSRNRTLVDAEAVEERRQTEPFLTHRAPAPR